MSTQTGAISGTVTDKKGKTLSKVKVTVKKGSGPAEITVTDSQGQFKFPNLPEGTYTLQAELSKFKSFVDRNVEVHPGGINEMEITLQQA
jgi:Carboxypeptidase regulatory-like domain